MIPGNTKTFLNQWSIRAIRRWPASVARPRMAGVTVVVVTFIESARFEITLTVIANEQPGYFGQKLSVLTGLSACQMNKIRGRRR